MMTRVVRLFDGEPMTTRAEVSLAVTLRPTSLEQLIGHDKIKPGIRKLIDKACRCWLFHGPTGTGKTSLAHIVAREIQGSDFPDDEEPDVIELDCAEQTEILRDVVNSSETYPMRGRVRVVILDEAHQLSKRGKTLLHKAFEKAGEVTTVWILCTTELRSIPEPLRDRCTGQFYLGPMESRERQMLVSRAAEHLNFTKDTSKFLREVEQAKIGSARKIIDAFERFADDVPIDEAIGE